MLGLHGGVLSWCFREGVGVYVSMVISWGFHGAYMVLTWCFYDAFMVLS